MATFRAGVVAAAMGLLLLAPAAVHADDGVSLPPAESGDTAVSRVVDLVPDKGFTSLADASSALLEAKAQAAQFREEADAAAKRYQEAQLEEESARAVHAQLEADLAAARMVLAERVQDVGQMAHQMYVSAGAMPGSPMAIMAIPSGVDLNAALTTQQYLTSASDFIVASEQAAREQEASLVAQVETARLNVEALQAATVEAQQKATEAEGLATQGAQIVTRVEEAVMKFVESLPVPALFAEDCARPSADTIAAAIYAQAKGLGLGDVAAILGIGVGLGESALSNDTEGDCWGGNCKNGRTSSRGVFQQMASWPPSGTAWSGQPAPQMGTGTRFDEFTGGNAWGPDGWAVTDPRMDPAQAANMFFLGPDYSATAGLEDNTLFQSLRNADPLSLSLDQMVTIAQQVQGFPPEHMGSYAQNMADAVGYYVRIKAGRIPIPDFRDPLRGMTKSATTPPTESAVRQSAARNDEGGTRDDTAPDVANDGLLMVGDSLMQGISRGENVPEGIFGGPVKSLSRVGIGTSAAIDRWAERIAKGPSRVLVALGSNDSGNLPASFGGQVDRLMSAAGPDRQVYWFLLHYRPVDALNVVLHAKARQYSNLHLVDVTDLLSPTSGYTSSKDKYLHPNAAGYQAMWTAASNVMRSGNSEAVVCQALSLNGTPANALAASALAFALAQLGKPYGYPEGNPPGTWDCSKLTGGAYNYAWVQAGRPEDWGFLSSYPFLAHSANSYAQYRSGHFVFLPIEQAQPGDYVFFNGDLGMSAGNPVDHVALILDPTNKILIEAGDPVGKNSYASRMSPDSSQPIVGPPKADGSPIMPGEPGWYPVVGRLLPPSAALPAAASAPLPPAPGP